MVTYWRFQEDDGLHGLVRRDDRAKSLTFAFLGQNGWVQDPNLYRHWVDPGDRWLVQVSEQEARLAAGEVALDAPPVEVRAGRAA